MGIYDLSRFNIFNPFNNAGLVVYDDHIAGKGTVDRSSIFKTTKKEDAWAKRILQNMIGERMSYRLANQTCRNFSQEMLAYLSNEIAKQRVAELLKQPPPGPPLMTPEEFQDFMKLMRKHVPATLGAPR